MKVLGVIPARHNSTRLAGKPLVDILGKPMIQHVYEAALQASTLERVVVATDDARVVDAVARFGGNVEMTSPAHISGTDRVAEIAARCDVDTIVNIQGDEPLIDPRMIDECVTGLRNGNGIEFSTVIKRISGEMIHDPAVVKVVRDQRGRALYFSRSLIPYPRNPAGANEVFEHIGLYAYTKACLLRLSKLAPTPLETIESLEQLRALENGIPIQAVLTSCEGELVSVDTPEDLAKVRTILSKRRRA